MRKSAKKTTITGSYDLQNSHYQKRYIR